MQITWGSWAWNCLTAAMLIPGHIATSNLWICLHACPMVSSVLQEDPCVSAGSEVGPSLAQPRPCTGILGHSLLCEPTAAGQVEVLQPRPAAGCLGPALITEEAAVTQRQALQARAAPGHSHQALICECWQQAQ